MDDLERYNEINKYITSVETFFEVFSVIAGHGLLGEIKNTSMNYLLTEMGEKLEAIKNLNKEMYDKLRSSAVTS
jgi:hypothetical protein